MTLYYPRQLRSCLSRNLLMLAYAIPGIFPGLDPEQANGSRYVFGWKDTFVVWLVVILAAGHSLNYWGLLLFLLSPAVPSMFLELGNDQFPGPRVWLSRWYLGLFGVVVMLSAAPAWLRWIYAGCWAVSSYDVSKFYESERRFFEQHKRENPNPDRYRLANLAFQYLRDGQQSLAEDEYRRVLEIDPENPKARAMVGLLEANRQWTTRGYVGLGFTCAFCGGKLGRMVKDGDRLTLAEHDAFFFRDCPNCGKRSQYSIVPDG